MYDRVVVLSKRRICAQDPSGMLLPSLALITRASTLAVAPLHSPHVVMMSFEGNPCPQLPEPISSAERETVTLGMG